MYVWKKQTWTSIITDNASNNKRTSLYHAHFFLSLLNILRLPSSCSLLSYFIVAVLMGSTLVHEFRIPIAIQNVTCFLTKRDGPCLGRRYDCQKLTMIIITYYVYRYIHIFTMHPVIKRPPYNQYLNNMCWVRLVSLSQVIQICFGE